LLFRQTTHGAFESCWSVEESHNKSLEHLRRGSPVTAGCFYEIIPVSEELRVDWETVGTAQAR